MILYIAIGIILITVVVLSVYYLILPCRDTIEVPFPESYFIQTPNRIDKQVRFECSAFSTAYVLRSFGIEGDGTTLYKTFPRKFPNGMVAPKGIVKYFSKRGFSVRYFKGTQESLKSQIAKGTPVIVLISVEPYKHGLHYIPIVGYNPDFYFCAESLGHKRNCNELSYNRKISAAEFDRLWKTCIPFHSNTYFVVSKK